MFLALARVISEDIRAGRLPAGARLPGSRALADRLGVNRSTVVAALQELSAQGWIQTRPGAGTYVADGLPRGVGTSRARRDPERIGFPLGPAPVVDLERPPHRGALVLLGGHPELADWPTDALARAYRRALQRRGERLLDYGSPWGEPRLRESLAAMLGERRGVVVDADDVLITRGSQMALDLAARALLRPGDVVAVEALGYRPAWRALAGAGGRVMPVDVDEGGIDVDALARLCRVEPVRAVYLTPHHQYPTGAVLDAGRRLALLQLAREHGFAILEDDYDNEFHFEGRPVPPLASLDDHGHVLYIGTLSKALAPGLRLGFCVGPRPLLRHLLAVRVRTDRQGDRVLETALAELMEDGVLARHIRRRHRLYAARRAALVAALREHLDHLVVLAPPAGGLALWCPLRVDVDVDAWIAAARQRAVWISGGSRYAVDGRPVAALRIGFARCPVERADEAARILAETCPLARA